MRKSILVFGAILIFLLPIQAGVWAQEKYVAKDNEELYGTWISQGPPKRFSNIPKLVLARDAFGNYSKVSASSPIEQGTLEIISKRVDSEGNIWYEARRTCKTGGERKASFGRISFCSADPQPQSLKTSIQALLARISHTPGGILGKGPSVRSV